MRLVAMCFAGLLLMQLPVNASIVSPTSAERGDESSWAMPYSYWAWDGNRSLFLFSGNERTGALEPFELMLTSLKADGLDLPFHWDSQVCCSDVPLLASLGASPGYGLENLDASELASEEAYARDVQTAAGLLCPEPATLTIWGVSTLALAAATYRRQKRGGKNGKHVQAAVKEYLEACDTPSQHFRMLGSYLTRLADDPNWTKQDVEAFYDEVVVALHRRREHAEVA